MLTAFLIGLLASSSLVIGGILANRLHPGNKLLGIVMGFGAGTLISAISFELVAEALRLAKGSGFPGFGLFAGAFTFYFADMFISRMGARDRVSLTGSGQARLVVPMVLAIILDGVPESIVIGLGMAGGGNVSMAMLVAVFISNLPESIAGSTGMRSAGWSPLKVNMLWLLIAAACAVATLAGFSLLGGASDQWLAFIQAFAGGAILMMLANSMMPEAYEHGGRMAGVFTVLGFALSLTLVLMETH